MPLEVNKPEVNKLVDKQVRFLCINNEIIIVLHGIFDKDMIVDCLEDRTDLCTYIYIFIFLNFVSVVIMTKTILTISVHFEING